MPGHRGVLKTLHFGSEPRDKTQRVVFPGFLLDVDLGLSPTGAPAYTSSIAYGGQSLQHEFSHCFLRRIIAFCDAQIA